MKILSVTGDVHQRMKVSSSPSRPPGGYFQFLVNSSEHKHMESKYPHQLLSPLLSLEGDWSVVYGEGSVFLE